MLCYQFCFLLAPVFQTSDSTIHQINHYPMDKYQGLEDRALTLSPQYTSKKNTNGSRTITIKTYSCKYKQLAESNKMTTVLKRQESPIGQIQYTKSPEHLCQLVTKQLQLIKIKNIKTTNYNQSKRFNYCANIKAQMTKKGQVKILP